jgi:hypothetical protein
VTVRYKKGLAYLFIAMGTINLFLGVWLLLLIGKPHFSIFIGILVLAIGIGYLTKPLVTVTDRGFVFKALIGPIERTFEFESLDRVRVENNKIFVQSNDGNSGGWKRVPINKMLVRSNDWRALNELIASKKI